MAVYVFKLLVGFFPNGVDNAQGYRAGMLRDFACPVKYLYTEVPDNSHISRYRKLGIDIGQMLSAHQYFTDNHSLETTVRVEDKLEELRESLRYTDIVRGKDEILIMRDGGTIAAILPDESNREYLYGIRYYNNGRLIRMEVYSDAVSYVNYYKTAEDGQRLYAKLTRRSYYNRDGSAAFDQIMEGEKEWYVFPNGKRCSKAEFLAEFVKKLGLTERDTVVIDSAGAFEFTQPLFKYGKNARIITVFHSGHYFEKGENPFGTFLNFEYYYWFKWSDRIDIMVVSTQEQKKELTEKLQEYHCSIPRIEVIPAGGIDRTRHPKAARNRCSLLSVSQLNERKRIDWIIRSVIKAHNVNPDISLDIYGCGSEEYISDLYDLISDGNAMSYIRFMGYADVTEVYKNYEVMISASLRETLGLSVMEAVASGCAVIGLDVRYGNRLFIHPDKNGYLIEFNLDYVNGDDSKLIEDMAAGIVDIFRDEARLKEFHEYSYEVSRDFLQEGIKAKWRALLA